MFSSKCKPLNHKLALRLALDQQDRHPFFKDTQASTKHGEFAGHVFKFGDKADYLETKFIIFSYMTYESLLKNFCFY